MNSFTLEILEGGEWVRPIAVFPFAVGELLDRLEARWRSGNNPALAGRF